MVRTHSDQHCPELKHHAYFTALAQSGGFAEGGLGLMPIILVMIIFYFLLIRPQQKRAKSTRRCFLP